MAMREVGDLLHLAADTVSNALRRGGEAQHRAGDRPGKVEGQQDGDDQGAGEDGDDGEADVADRRLDLPAVLGQQQRSDDLTIALYRHRDVEQESPAGVIRMAGAMRGDRKSTRLNSSH